MCYFTDVSNYRSPLSQSRSVPGARYFDNETPEMEEVRAGGPHGRFPIPGQRASVCDPNSPFGWTVHARKGRRSVWSRGSVSEAHHRRTMALTRTEPWLAAPELDRLRGGGPTNS